MERDQISWKPSSLRYRSRKYRQIGRAFSHAVSAPRVQRLKAKTAHYRYHGRQRLTLWQRAVCCANRTRQSARKWKLNRVHPERLLQCTWCLVRTVTGLSLQPGNIRRGTRKAVFRITNVFPRRDLRMRDSGNALPTPSMDRDRPGTCRTSAQEDIVLDMVAHSSIQETALQLGSDYLSGPRPVTIGCLYTQVQGLMPNDSRPRLQDCEWLDPVFVEHNLWTDEMAFTREGV
jgi:hypothetical protein